MKTVREFIDERNAKIIAEWGTLYNPGMKKAYIHRLLSRKYKIEVPTLAAIIKKYGY